MHNNIKKIKYLRFTTCFFLKMSVYLSNYNKEVIYMKKLVCLVLFLVILAVPMLAQMNDMMLGGKAGLTMGRASLDGDPMDETFRLGFVAGGFMVMPLQENMHLQAEVLYAQKGEKWTNGEDVNLNIDVLEVPVLVKFFPIENMNVYAGPTLNYIMTAKVKMDSGDIDLKDEELIKTMGFGISLGTQYFFENIFVDARYDMGLTDLNDQEESDEEIKLNTIYFSVGYMF